MTYLKDGSIFCRLARSLTHRYCSLFSVQPLLRRFLLSPAQSSCFLIGVQEYVEREDEFDVNPRSPERPPTIEADGDVEVDVVTADSVDALYYSTDEDPATAPPRLHHLPLEIEPERPSTPQ